MAALITHVLAAAAGVVALVAVTPVAAAADDVPTLLISHDGSPFAPSGTTSLFGDVGRVVPGDEATETLVLRSTSATAGRVRLDVVGATTDDAALASATTVEFRIGDGSDAQVVNIGAAVDGGGCFVAVDAPRLDSSRDLAVQVTLRVDPRLGERAGDDSRAGARGSTGFGVRASIADPVAPAAISGPVTCASPAPATNASPQGALPATGVAAMNPPAIAAVAILLGGGALMLFRRRSQEESHD